MEKEKTYGVWAVRSALRSLGGRKAGARRTAGPFEFASQEAAEAYAKECNNRTTANVHYYVKRKRAGTGRCPKGWDTAGQRCLLHENRRPETRRWKN